MGFARWAQTRLLAGFEVEGNTRTRRAKRKKKQVPSLERTERTQGQKIEFESDLNGDSPDDKGEKKTSKPDEESGGDGRRQEQRLDDGMCASMCEQMRLIKESRRKSQVTSEEMQRLVEQVGRFRTAMADLRKQATEVPQDAIFEHEVQMKESQRKIGEIGKWVMFKIHPRRLELTTR